MRSGDFAVPAATDERGPLKYTNTPVVHCNRAALRLTVVRPRCQSQDSMQHRLHHITPVTKGRAKESNVPKCADDHGICDFVSMLWRVPEPR